MNRIAVHRHPSGWTAVVTGIGVVVATAAVLAAVGWAIAVLVLVLV